MARSPARWLIPILALALLPLLGGRPASAQAEPMPLPDVAPAVNSLLEQEFLRPEERAALRLRHGLWTDADLAEPSARAIAALARGDLREPALAEPTTDPLIRAHAHLLSGRPEAVLDVLPLPTSPRAARLRAQALLDLGRPEEARALLQPLADDMLADRAPSAEHLIEGARALALLPRAGVAPPGQGESFRSAQAALDRARDRFDRLDWSPRLAEAAILMEKDAFEDAQAAIAEALTLHPRLAEGWYLLGRLAVLSFDADRTERIAARLDALASPGLSIDAARLRALMHLRQSEGQKAQAALAPALAAFPNHRGLRALDAAAAAAAFDDAGAEQRLAAFDTLAPNSPEAWLAVGDALAEARQYAPAARALRVAAERAPQWTRPWIELGLSQLQAGDLADARAALEHAATLDQFNDRAINSLTLLRELDSFAVLESEHFIVRFKPGPDELLAREMMPILERIFARVTGSAPGGIRHVPEGKTTIELYPNHRWFAVRIAGMPALHTIAAATGPVIAMEAPRSGPGHLVGPYDWARVVQHEYVHTVTLSRTRNRLPHWFTEAAAVYLEDSPRDASTVSLLARAVATQTLFDLDTINLMFVRPKRPTDRSQAYAQGAWMYEWIIETFGPEAPLALMDLYAAGVREEEAFQRVLGISREAFLERFKEYARERMVAWGMLPTEGVPDVPTLVRTEGIQEPTAADLRRWLEAHPGNPFVLDALVAAERQAGTAVGEMVPMLEALAAARPLDDMPRKLLAGYFLGMEDAASRERAVELLAWLDAREQSTPEYARQLARLHAAAGRMEAAMVQAMRATRIAPYDASVREFAATMALRAGDVAEARRQIEALVVLEPDREIHRRRLEAVKARQGP